MALGKLTCGQSSRRLRLHCSAFAAEAVRQVQLICFVWTVHVASSSFFREANVRYKVVSLVTKKGIFI